MFDADMCSCGVPDDLAFGFTVKKYERTRALPSAE
jgi:hypothetical protein